MISRFNERTGACVSNMDDCQVNKETRCAIKRRVFISSKALFAMLARMEKNAALCSIEIT